MKRNSRLIFVGLFLLIFNNSQAQMVNGLPNPAVAYCNSLGYHCHIISEKDGSEKSVCVLPDSSIVDVWDFFRGKVKQQYSYCSLKGYNTISKTIIEEDYFMECAYCQSIKNKIKIVENETEIEATEVPMLELMIQNGDIDLPMEPNTIITDDVYDNDDFIFDSVENRSLPETFDLRNYSGESYIGGIQDQGDCGACYAFGAAATAEGTYNFATGSYGNDRKSFSESFIAWCLGTLNQYSSHFYGCGGSDNERKEVESLTQYGIIERFNFPYQTYGISECNHWNDSKAIFSGWGRVACGNIDAIKSAIVTYGVVFANLYAKNSFINYSRNIYSNADTDCDASPCYNYSNHVVALVGWGKHPTKGEYWILRNSWGTNWGEDGYMRIKMTSARIACGVTYLIPNPVVFEADNIAEHVIIKNGKNVVFKGHNDVLLSNGFEAKEGSQFYAYIQNNRNNIVERRFVSENSRAGCSSKIADNQIIENNSSKKSVLIYPNPVQKILHIKVDEDVSKIEVKNIYGAVLLEQISPSTPVSINLSNLPRGIYLLLIYTDKEVVTRKIIKS